MSSLSLGENRDSNLRPKSDPLASLATSCPEFWFPTSKEEGFGEDVGLDRSSSLPDILDPNAVFGKVKAEKEVNKAKANKNHVHYGARPRKLRLANSSADGSSPRGAGEGGMLRVESAPTPPPSACSTRSGSLST